MITLFGGNRDITLQWWTFPGGERNVKIVDPGEIERFGAFTVRCDFRSSDDLIDMLLLVNAIRNVNRNTKLRLLIPYFPFARQDRVMTPGEPFALQVMVNIIKSCNFNEVEVWDPHSDVLSGMFEPGVLNIVPQEDLVRIGPDIDACIVSPDAGALKKIYKVAKRVNLPVVEANKVRDVETGQIIKTKIDDDIKNYTKAYIVDDIIDYGGTFIALADAMRKSGFSGKLCLCVTHGIFSGGAKPLEHIFDEIKIINMLNDEVRVSHPHWCVNNLV